MMHGREKSDSDEQGGAIRRGAGGAKGGDQGECAPAKHVPGAVPDTRVTSAGSHTTGRSSHGGSFIPGYRALRRHLPEVGAVCLNWARTDLCGGRSAMSVPTAISHERRA